MPRLVACPVLGCSGANFLDFRYCQWCGTARKVVSLQMPAGHQQAKIDDIAILQRRQQLVTAMAIKSHSVAKDKEFEAFEIFVYSRSAGFQRCSVFQATPADVVDFIIYRDMTGEGRTVVHQMSCMNRPRSGCGCPVGLSAESIRGLASKLKTRFYELGCCGAWNASDGSGNPADSGLVSMMVRAIREEQAKAGVNIMSARRKALLPQKLEQLLNKLCTRADELYEQAHQRSNQLGIAVDLAPVLRVMQDAAWFAVQFRALNRGSELQNLRTGGTFIGPNACCIGFQFTFSKVMRAGGSMEFGVQQRPGDPTCPVLHFKKYVALSSSVFHWNWDIDGALVFDSFDKFGARTNTPVTAGAMNQRFQTYLKLFGMDDSETSGILESLHGLRAGGALELALAGESLTDIMLQGFWKRPSTALHYIGLLSRVVGDEFVEALQAQKWSWASQNEIAQHKQNSKWKHAAAL